jgi:outer membrane protein assembly factor BamB
MDSFFNPAIPQFLGRVPAWLVAAWALVATLQSSRPACAAPGDFLFKLTAPDARLGAGFGEVLSAANGNIIVGEPKRSIDGEAFVGRAYVFDGQTGALRLTLNDPEPINRSTFGSSLAGGDGSIFVGGGAIADRGRVYAFDDETGTLRLQIDGPNGGRDGFASGIAYGNGNLLVSAPSFSGVPFQAQSIGRAYMFDAVTGNLGSPLPNPEPKALDVFSFGSSLAIVGNKAVVGAVLDDLRDDNRPDGDNPGRVWVFDRVSRDILFTLENPNPESELDDSFASNLAANEEIIAVGAQEDGTSGVDGSGTVYVFETTTGALRHTLFSPQLEINGEFGRSVAVTPNGDVLVGAWNTSVSGVEGAGHAYLFDGETGELLLDIPNPVPDLGVFGWSVSATENKLFISAPAGTGAVYVFEVIPEPSSLVLIGSLLIGAIAIGRIQAVGKRQTNSAQRT